VRNKELEIAKLSTCVDKKEFRTVSIPIFAACQVSVKLAGIKARNTEPRVKKSLPEGKVAGGVKARPDMGHSTRRKNALRNPARLPPSFLDLLAPPSFFDPFQHQFTLHFVFLSTVVVIASIL
jgi:hypothetical protein